MRLLPAVLIALFCASVSPAWAYLETLPGDEEWPEIPDQEGMGAFVGTWMPQCNVGGITYNDMTLHPDGRITYERGSGFPSQYRVIEETPYYVIALAYGKEGYINLWALRPLGKSFHSPDETDMNRIGINTCHYFADNNRWQEIWELGDAELLEFWKTNKDCHPTLTQKTVAYDYWGEGWGQYCNYARRNLRRPIPY